MKINFRYQDGNRSSMTLQDKLIDVWALSQGQEESEKRTIEEMLNTRVIAEALKHQRDPKVTLVSVVECLLLDEIAEAIQFDMVRR